MNLAQAIHERWAEAAALNALLPVSRVYTGASFDPALPLVVISKQSDKPDSYQSDGSAIDVVVLQMRVLHARYDAAAEIMREIKKAFDRTSFDLADGDTVQNMQRINDYERQRADGAWELIIDFKCTIYLASGRDMTFKAQIKASLGWDWNEGIRDNGRLEYAKALSTGSGDNQAEAVWYLEHQVLAVGAACTYDLTALGRVVLGMNYATAFTTIKALLVTNESTDGGELLVGGAASNPWSEPFGGDGDRVLVPADSAMLLSNRQSGWPADATARNLRIAASGGDVTYSIAIVGTLAPAASGSGSGCRR